MPKPDVSDQRINMILAAARELFAHHSLKEVKMQDIARQAGLSVGGVYWYFKSKDEIIRALLTQNAETNISALKALSEMNIPARQRLQLFLDGVLNAAEGLRELYLTGAKYQAMSSPDIETRAEMEHIESGYRNGLENIIAQGVAGGEFISINPKDVANAFIGAYEGLMLLWVMSPEKMHLKEAMQATAALLLTGLTCPLTENSPGNGETLR
ncbi:MAG: TetR/AcrR family transcriptional regulator [Anaerolineales bacterium]|nr:TetR/AcrR family transcriptional regulator [Anaerolineales bacterium]